MKVPISLRVPIAATPVDDQQNRAHARVVGEPWITWPVPPPGSVPMTCEHCGGAVLLDPEAEQLREELSRSGLRPIVVCRVCIAVAYGAAVPPDNGERLASFKDALERLRDDPRERERIDQIAAEADAAGIQERY